MADDLDFSNLKKKKNKSAKVVAFDAELEGTASPAPSGGADESAPASDAGAGAGADDEVFKDLKKKKKSKKKFDLDAFERELAGDQETPKSSRPGSEDEGANDTPAADDGIEESKSKSEIAAEKQEWLVDTERDYTYIELLGRLYQSLYASHPTLSTSGKKRYTLAPPVVQREGKRSVFANLSDICKKMHRQPDHVIQFLFAELGTSGSVDGAGRLVIKGRFQQKQIEAVLRRYVVDYVTCKTCKSPDTLLSKDNRMYFVTCQICGSSRSVAAIKSGFQAQIGRRKAMAAKAG